MARHKDLQISVGQQYEEPLPGARKILAAFNLNTSDKNSHPKAIWNVIDVVEWNGLPHARLENAETGETRLLASSVLLEGRLYKFIATSENP